MNSLNMWCFKSLITMWMLKYKFCWFWCRYFHHWEYSGIRYCHGARDELGCQCKYHTWCKNSTWCGTSNTGDIFHSYALVFLYDWHNMRMYYMHELCLAYTIELSDILLEQWVGLLVLVLNSNFWVEPTILWFTQNFKSQPTMYFMHHNLVISLPI